jgi:hypothetical protein
MQKVSRVGHPPAVACTLMPADRGDNSDSKPGTNPVPSIKSIKNSLSVWIQLAYDRVKWMALVKTLMKLLHLYEVGNFLDQLSDYQHLNKDSCR